MSAPIYLYIGPEAGERKEAVEKIKKTLRKDFGDLEEYNFYASETSVNEFMSVLQNESLFSSATCVVVKNAEVIKKKEDIETIVNWVSSVNTQSSVLILTSDSVSIDTKIEKAVPTQNKKIFWEMFEDRKLSWVFDFFKKNGYSISEDAANAILELVENNTEALRNECSRFFVCFPSSKEITESDVESILVHNREESAFSLFDSISNPSVSENERLQKGLEILQRIRLSKDNSSVMLIAGLTSCFRKLSTYHKLQSARMNDDFNLKINGFSSKKMKTQYNRASKVWTVGQVVAILSLLSSADMSIRSSGTLLEDTLLQKLLYEIIIKKGGTSAVYDFSLN